MDVLVFTHGELSVGIKSAVRMLLGNVNELKILTLDVEDNIDEVEESLIQLLDEDSNIGLVLVDMVGGSPFNLAMKHSREFDYRVITGVNLPLVLELLNSVSEVDSLQAQQTILESVQTAKSNIEIYSL